MKLPFQMLMSLMTLTSVVAPVTAVVTEASVPTLSGGLSIEGSHGGGGTVTGSDGGGLDTLAALAVAVEVVLAWAVVSVVCMCQLQLCKLQLGVTSVEMAAIKDSMVRNTPPLSNLTPTFQLTFNSSQPVVNEPPSTQLETFRASEFLPSHSKRHGTMAT